MTPLASPPAALGDRMVAVACPVCHAALAASAAAAAPARCPLCLSGFIVPESPPQRRPAADQPDDARSAEPRHLTREERDVRRARRNILRLVGGVVILLAFVLLFGTRRPKKPR